MKTKCMFLAFAVIGVGYVAGADEPPQQAKRPPALVELDQDAKDDGFLDALSTGDLVLATLYLQAGADTTMIKRKLGSNGPNRSFQRVVFQLTRRAGSEE